VTRLTTAMLVRNEAAPDRYLRRVIEHCKTFSDDIVVLDDASTDETPKVAEALGCHVARRTSGDGFWGVAETPLRKTLWELGSRVASDGWLLICDADMLLQGDVRALCASWDAAAWAFPLVDLWDSEETFRVDGPWGFGPRPWLFRPSALREVAQWPETRSTHVGHAPLNFGAAGPTFVAPPDVFWKHLSYLKREHRLTKLQAYLSVPDLTPFEHAHARSIGDV
jgi:glycosyltransferase involved in cell wall biosynthesis